MKTGPDIARIAALVGEPARANMLSALMSGLALTARELAREAGVQPSTASSHLDALRTAKLIAFEKQGRHHYFRIANAQVAQLIETLANVSETAGFKRVRTGPKEPALRKARACYDHLAGEMGVLAYDSMCARGFLALRHGEVTLTNAGRRFASDLGIPLDQLAPGNRPLCRPCLDWSERRHHLAGAFGAAVLNHILAEKWAHRDANARIIRFTAQGEQRFRDVFSVSGVGGPAITRDRDEARPLGFAEDDGGQLAPNCHTGGDADALTKKRMTAALSRKSAAVG